MCEISPKQSVPSLSDILDGRHCILYLRNLLAFYRQNGQNEQGSIPDYVIKKGPSHGARHGNTERQRIYNAAHTAVKKAKKKGHDVTLARFQNCPIYRESQIAIG